MPETTTPTPERAAALSLLADYVTVYAGLPDTDQAQRIHPTRLVDSLVPCLRKHKGRVVWRKSAPTTGGQDSTTFYTFHRAHRMATEGDVYRLLMLNLDIGSIEYLIWETTFATLRTIEKVRAKQG